MRKLGWAICLVGLAISVRCASVAGQGPDEGPGDGDAALKNPFDPTPPRRAPSPGASRPGTTEVEKAFFGKDTTQAPNPYADNGPGAIEGTAGRPKGLAALKPSERDDINRDIAINPAQGPWLISIMSYIGPKAPEMAREFALELRTTYKLQAFVFNYGTEERRKEYERVKDIVDRQRKFCEESNLPLEQKIRIRYTYVPDQCAVLVGGYTSEDAARREVERIRKLPMPDPAKVKMDVKFFAIGEEMRHEKSGQLTEFNLKRVDETAGGYINPFKRAFLVHNPTIKIERKVEADPLDMTVLKKLNTGEPYSLLTCRKPITLAITQFRTPTTSDESAASAAPGLMGALGLGQKKERRDYAADNAVNLVENMRKHMKLDAYVLHTRYASIVTVGGYDSVDDPNLRSMKSLLQSRLRIPGVEMFSEPYPMNVPH